MHSGSKTAAELHYTATDKQQPLKESRGPLPRAKQPTQNGGPYGKGIENHMWKRKI